MRTIDTVDCDSIDLAINGKLTAAVVTVSGESRATVAGYFVHIIRTHSIHMASSVVFHATVRI